MPIPGLEPKQFVSEEHLHRAYTRMATSNHVQPSLPEWDIQNSRPFDFCFTECMSKKGHEETNILLSEVSSI